MFSACMFAMQAPLFSGTVQEYNDRFETERAQAAATFISDFNTRNKNATLTFINVKSFLTHDADFNIREILWTTVELKCIGELAGLIKPIKMDIPIPYTDPHKGEIAKFDSEGNSI